MAHTFAFAPLEDTMSKRKRCCLITVALLVVALVAGVVRFWPTNDDEPLPVGVNGALPDYTNVTLKRLRIEPVRESVDPQTGFRVGGTNATDLIRNLTQINGKTIAQLEKDMRPGQYSEDGFLGPTESLLDVLAENNQFVVDELGLTHQELARYLQVFARIGFIQLGQITESKDERERDRKWSEKERGFLFHGRRFKVDFLGGTLGSQESPFDDGTQTNCEAMVYNLDNGKKLWYSLLVPDMIERYGFYEGKGTRYRVDPREIIEVLDFLKEKSRSSGVRHGEGDQTRSRASHMAFPSRACERGEASDLPLAPYPLPLNFLHTHSTGS
jgi:hypothetical protein